MARNTFEDLKNKEQYELWSKRKLNSAYVTKAEHEKWETQVTSNTMTIGSSDTIGDTFVLQDINNDGNISVTENILKNAQDISSQANDISTIYNIIGNVSNLIDPDGDEDKYNNTIVDNINKITNDITNITNRLNPLVTDKLDVILEEPDGAMCFFIESD